MASDTVEAIRNRFFAQLGINPDLPLPPQWQGQELTFVAMWENYLYDAGAGLLAQTPAGTSASSSTSQTTAQPAGPLPVWVPRADTSQPLGHRDNPIPAPANRRDRF